MIAQIVDLLPSGALGLLIFYCPLALSITWLVVLAVRRKVALIEWLSSATVFVLVLGVYIVLYLAEHRVLEKENRKQAEWKTRHQRLEQQDKVPYRLTLDGQTLRIDPDGATLQIPISWIEHDEEYHNGIHLTRQELQSLRDADGEWDKEYATIVNAALPFDQCVAHLGSEGWGTDGVSYHDIQMRVYVVDLAPYKIAESIVDKGAKKASQFSRQVNIAQSEFDGWNRGTLRYALKYSDYGGIANIDVFARPLGNRSLALVFMYADSLRTPEESVTAVAKSVNIPHSETR